MWIFYLQAMEEIYTVYAICSKKDGRIYVGFSRDAEKRLLQHNQGKTKSTKGYVPWELIYTQQIIGRENAREREIELKSGSGKEFLKNLRDFKNNR